MALKFTQYQRDDLRVLSRSKGKPVGLGTAQINELEKILPLAKALDAKAEPMQGVRSVLNDARQKLDDALPFVSKIIYPLTPAQREASVQVLLADEDSNPVEEDEAIKNVLLAILEANFVLDRALSALPLETYDRTHPWILQAVDRALLTGHLAERGNVFINEDGMKQVRPYRCIQPSRRGNYKKVIQIVFDAIGRPADYNPDRTEPDRTDRPIRNHLLWLQASRSHCK